MKGSILLPEKQERFDFATEIGSNQRENKK